MTKWDTETCVDAVLEFYSRKGRPPKYEELNNRHGLPCIETLRKYTHDGILDDIWEDVLGVTPAADIVSAFIIDKSEGGTKPFFYLNSKQIAGWAGVDIRKIGTYMRTVNGNGKVVAGYQLKGISSGDGTRLTFLATRQTDS